MSLSVLNLSIAFTPDPKKPKKSSNTSFVFINKWCYDETFYFCVSFFYKKNWTCMHNILFGFCRVLNENTPQYTLSAAHHCYSSYHMAGQTESQKLRKLLNYVKICTCMLNIKVCMLNVNVSYVHPFIENSTSFDRGNVLMRFPSKLI